MAGRRFTQRADGTIDVRTTRSVWFAVGLGPAMTLLWILAVVAPAVRHGGSGAWVTGALTVPIAVVGGVVAWRSLGVSFRENDGVLVVRNTFRTHRFGWDAVDSFAVRKMSAKYGDRALVLRPRAGSGAPLVVQATFTRSPEHLANILATVRARAEAHGVTVDDVAGGAR